MSLGETLSDTRILLIFVFWIAVNVYFGLTASPSLLTGGDGGIAWEAHIGGFVCGLLIFGFFDEQAPAAEETSQL